MREIPREIPREKRTFRNRTLYRSHEIRTLRYLVQDTTAPDTLMSGAGELQQQVAFGFCVCLSCSYCTHNDFDHFNATHPNPYELYVLVDSARAGSPRLSSERG